MGYCALCGESAGVFRNVHSSCEAKAESLKKGLREVVFAGALAGKPFNEIHSEVTAKIGDNHLSSPFFDGTLLRAANDVVAEIAKQSPISNDTFTRLADLLKGFGYPQDDKEKMVRQKYFGMGLAGMSYILWATQNGYLPSPEEVGQISFNLQRSERAIFSAAKVLLAEEQSAYSTSRSYGGLSLPIGAGAYYHFGASQRNQASGLLPIDVGEMLITSQSLYFGGQKTTMRISLAHVLRYEPYTDAVGVCESSGPPKVFFTGLFRHGYRLVFLQPAIDPHVEVKSVIVSSAHPQK